MKRCRQASNSAYVVAVLTAVFTVQVTSCSRNELAPAEDAVPPSVRTLPPTTLTVPPIIQVTFDPVHHGHYLESGPNPQLSEANRPCFWLEGFFNVGESCCTLYWGADQYNLTNPR